MRRRPYGKKAQNFFQVPIQFKNTLGNFKNEGKFNVTIIPYFGTLKNQKFKPIPASPATLDCSTGGKAATGRMLYAPSSL
jgi:hypothetical protein